MKRAPLDGRGGDGYRDNVAQAPRFCPLACIAYHDEPLTNRRGDVRATECTLCGQIVARSTWADLLADADGAHR